MLARGEAAAGNRGMSADEALRRARALAPELRARAVQADETRIVPRENIQSILDAGLFHILAPKIFGGSQLGITSLIEITAEIATACGSTGWLFGVLSGHYWMISQYGQEAQRDIFGSENSLTASVVKLGGNPPRRVPGGYRIEGGAGKYCSGIDHAGWILLGTNVSSAGAPPEPCYMLIPKGDVEVVDDWFTVGLRGTGSRSIRIHDAFIPGHRFLPVADLVRGQTPGALFHDASVYRAPFPQVLPLSLAGVPSGIARSATESFIGGQKARMAGWPEDQIAGEAVTFARISNACADVDAAAALLMKDCAEIDRCADGSQMTAIDRARIIRDIAHAGGLCRAAVNCLFEVSGGGATYDTSQMQRIWRDMNTATAHNTFGRDRGGAMFGRAILGLPPGKYDRIGR